MDDSTGTASDNFDALVTEAASKRPLAFAAWLAVDVAVNKLIGIHDHLTAQLRDAAGAP
jgi:hypothetical protein